MLIAMMIAAEVTPTTQAITFAIIGGVITIVTLLVNNHTKKSTEIRIEQTRQDIENRRMIEKREDALLVVEKEQRDYARQDLVAERLERQSQLTMRKLSDVEDLSKVTHALVNSDKTAAMRSERDDCAVTLVLMRELVALREQVGSKPTIESAQTIDALGARIASLDVAIAERLAAQHHAESQAQSSMPPPAIPGAAAPPFVALISPKPTD